jgi:hypothetical protein
MLRRRVFSMSAKRDATAERPTDDTVNSFGKRWRLTLAEELAPTTLTGVAIAAAREPFRSAEVLPSSARAARDMAHLSRTFGGFEAMTRLAAQADRFQRLVDPFGIAKLNALHQSLNLDRGFRDVLSSLPGQRSLVPQLADVLGPVAALREQHRFLSDMLGTTRMPTYVGMESVLRQNAPFLAALKSARSFGLLDTKIAGMFPSTFSDTLRAQLVAPSLGVVAALGALDRPTNLGVLTALPGLDAASLGWFHGGLGRGHIRAALLHAERSQRRVRQTWRIELPAEVPCDCCGAPVNVDRLGYITLVGERPDEEVFFATLCGDCAGTGEQEAHARAEEALRAVQSLRRPRLALEVLQGGGRGDGIARGRGILRLVYRDTEVDEL